MPAPLADHLGAFAVTKRAWDRSESANGSSATNDDYNSIMTKALADRLAEAFAECLHKRVREDWGYGKTENLTTDDLIRERYRGIRPAAGYPACPDHTEKRILWDLMDVERRAGMKLTESCAMYPAEFRSGLYFAHSRSEVFRDRKIERDQVLDYHKRKGDGPCTWSAGWRRI